MTQPPDNEPYEVYAIWLEDDMSTTQEFVGSLDLPELKTWQDYPIELEINGVIYKKED
jgi:hypothetical protein